LFKFNICVFCVFVVSNIFAQYSFTPVTSIDASSILQTNNHLAVSNINTDEIYSIQSALNYLAQSCDNMYTKDEIDEKYKDQVISTGDNYSYWSIDENGDIIPSKIFIKTEEKWSIDENGDISPL